MAVEEKSAVSRKSTSRMRAWTLNPARESHIRVLAALLTSFPNPRNESTEVKRSPLRIILVRYCRSSSGCPSLYSACLSLGFRLAPPRP